jgi:hypothetical protein
VLRQDLFLKAINTLYTYPDNISKQQLQMEIARITVMVSEAVRLIPIRNRIVLAWPNPTSLTKDEVKYMVTWGKMSMLIMCESVNLQCFETLI